MAAVTTMLKKTNGEAVVRVTASAGGDTATIALGDLIATNEVATTPSVQIDRVYHAQSGTNFVEIERNSVLIGTFTGYGTFEGWPLTDEPTSNIDITFGGAGMIILSLKKVGGFNSPIEYAQYGAYDDETAVGS